MRPRGTTTTMILFCFSCMFGAAWLTSSRPQQDRAAIRSNGKEKDGPQRNPVVLQDKTNNCGAAALKMILDHFGYRISLRDLECRLAPSSRGTSLQRLKEIADKLGLQARGLRLGAEELACIQYPMIIFLRKNHFAVADSLDAGGFLSVRDPAVGRSKIAQGDLFSIWGGEALVFSCSQTRNSGTWNTEEEKQK